MDLLEQIEAYLARSHVAPSRFGRLAAGDPRLVADLKSGRRLRQRTEERLRRYLTKAAAEVPSAGAGRSPRN
ncbi:hypothetical protein [Novosphingobium fuchskuhlense]|uniref:hypothetical protein n=1 Tax=Novosphingobium fuchskuhlense TaxID=1117702 RepID=UPI0009EBD8DA|nr:hypothetical protein [Novosphingobium fuchskuhlense]